MKRPDIPLTVVESDGPLVTDTGEVYHCTPCGGCGGEIEQGELIAKLERSWMHQECAAKQLSAADVRNAWALIGLDIARNPRAYSVPNVRAVLHQLVGFVYRDEFEDA
ncbi:hypothetical protein [Amycolatopsis palatopharyngis]|uniref:hypothetical protein n=1 Tax=Amycolatopsis palatopharyngis TaxID=187982 RepID=UPI0013BE9545|nr:hypothetical protein [Amycolatopsis palatopharyngis]